jgi:Domain of unknown function (DUF5667)
LSRQFEERLNECLEALSSGQRTLEECLSMYPEDASRLEPMLRAAMMLKETFAAQPRPQFAASARERFMRMTPPRLEESLSFEPRESFVMAARRRFLAAAQRMVEERKPARWRPAFRVAQFASATAVVFVMGFGGFAVTTSASALPGDWQYPVKRGIEDIRYTLTFDDGGKKQLDIEFTRERLSEVQKLADEGRPISEGTLKDLTSQTNSLVTRLDNSDLNVNEAKKVEELAKQQQDVLTNLVAPLVDPKASDELVEAKKVSTEAFIKATLVVTGEDLKATPEPTVASIAEATATETATPVPTDSEPLPAETAEPETPTPVPTEVTPIPGAVVVVPVEDEDAAGITWSLVVMDRFSVEVPAESSGWRFMGLTVGPDETVEAPFMLRVVNADASAIIIVNPRNGDTYWEQYLDDGLFHEFRVRISDGETVWQASVDELNSFYAANAAIVQHMLDTVKIEPPPTPTPEPTGTPTPEAGDVITHVTPSP